MTSVIVPPVDLAPGMPSRVVTVSATDLTEGGQSLAGQKVTFALSDSLDVVSGGDVIAKTTATITLDADGNGSIRLPVYSEDVRTWCGKDWAILVTAFGSGKAVRVPAGSSSIALSALSNVRPLTRREQQWAITGVSVTVTSGAPAGGTGSYSGGILNLALTIPSGDFYKGTLTAGTDIDTVKEPGLYTLSSANTYVNRPAQSGAANVNASLLVGSQGSTWATQTFIQHGPIAVFLWRSTFSSTVWNPWRQVSDGRGRGELPANTDVDLARGPEWGGSWSISGTTTTGTMTGTLPPGHTGWQPGQIVIHGIGGGTTNLSSQMYMPYTAVGSRSVQVWYRTIDRYGQTGATAWSPWVDLAAAGSGGGGNPSNIPTNALAVGGREIRMQLFRDAYPLVSTGGKGAVVFRYDHGLTNFKNVLLPLHQQYNLPAYIAMNSRNWDLAENSGATQAEAKTWANVEWGNHTATHNDKTGINDIYEAVALGRIELEEQVGKTVHGFTVPGLPGADGNSYSKLDGFNVGYPAGFSNSYAGSLILNHHAIASGVIGPQFRPLDGVIRQGGRHYGWENRAWDGAEGIKALIDEAITSKTALTLMQHPRTMNLNGYWTPALAEQVISYVREQIDAGNLADISYYQSHHAQLAPLATPAFDTGWRHITQRMYGWTGGDLFYRRTADEVQIVFKGLDGTAATNAAVATLPTGFGPDTFTGGSQAFFVRSQLPLDSGNSAGPTKDFWGSAGSGFLRLEIGQVSRTGTWASIRFPAEAARPDMSALPGTARV